MDSDIPLNKQVLTCKVCGEPRDLSLDQALCLSCKRKIYKDRTAKWRANLTPEEKEAYLASIRLSQLKKRLKAFNLTLRDYEAQLIKQGYSCGICLIKEPGGPGGWHLDHDHITGEFRGLLCTNCNLGLGNFKDSVQNLQRAIGYLATSLKAQLPVPS